MLKTIKFELPVKDRFDLTIPQKAEILSLTLEDQIPCLHVLIEPTAEQETRRFVMVRAGEFIDEPRSNLWYLGNFQLSAKTPSIHLFEVVGKKLET